GRCGLVGNSLIPTTSAALRERNKVKVSGSVTATVVVDAAGQLLAPPGIRLLGIVDPAAEEATGASLMNSMVVAIQALGPASLKDDAAVQDAAEHALKKASYRKLGLRPVCQVMVARLG
ncbi:MAG: hypothetical protein ACPGUF_06450, partial [Litorivicinus sp.]